MGNPSGNGIVASLRERLAVFSPRRWRWQHFLRSLPVDPERLDRPVTEPGLNDFIICGVPRSGTTLLAAMLFQPPHVVTVMEPWDGMRLPPARLFASLREEIDTTGALSRGKLDVDVLRDRGGVRWKQEGEASVSLPDMASGYALGVKWPAFWRYVELLPNSRFLICVRDPFEVVNSFKKEGGRLAEGLMYDTAFNRAMHIDLLGRTEDPELRRVLLYAYISERLRPYLDAPNVFVVHYERWFIDPDALLDEIAAFLNVPITEPPARLRDPGAPAQLTAPEMDLIRRHAQVAVAFGYDLSHATGP